MKNKIVQLVVVLLISGCSATSELNTKTNLGQIVINDNSPMIISPDTAVKKSYSTTSFGQFNFKLSESAINQTMYGVVPLKFNGGYLAADILFFAPAMFFNLREFYPFYEFDVASGTIKYKKFKSEPWTIHQPTDSEILRAKKYFNVTEMNRPADNTSPADNALNK